MVLRTKPVKMLQHGYNESEVAPYLYEASTFSTTIALHCEVARVSIALSIWGFDPLGV